MLSLHFLSKRRMAKRDVDKSALSRKSQKTLPHKRFLRKNKKENPLQTPGIEPGTFCVQAN